MNEKTFRSSSCTPGIPFNVLSRTCLLYFCLKSSSIALKIFLTSENFYACTKQISFNKILLKYNQNVCIYSYLYKKKQQNGSKEAANGRPGPPKQNVPGHQQAGRAGRVHQASRGQAVRDGEFEPGSSQRPQAEGKFRSEVLGQYGRHVY